MNCVRNVETDANVNVYNLYSESYIDTTDQGSHNYPIDIEVAAETAASLISCG